MEQVGRPNQRRVAIVGLFIAVVSFSSLASTASGEASFSDVGEDAWSQLGADINGDADSLGFGQSVAVSDDGTRVVIGSPALVDESQTASYVQVREWNGSNWQQVGNDIETTSSESNLFGFSVAISSDGNRIAVGDVIGPDGYDVGGEGTDSGVSVPPGAARDGLPPPPGAVRVFDWDGSTWQQVGEPILGTVAEAAAGLSVALSSAGEHVVVGSFTRPQAFKYDSVDGWTQMGGDIGDTSHLGGAVAMSADGTRVAVGLGFAFLSMGEAQQTVVQVFDYNVSDGWIQVGSDISGDDWLAGVSVAITSDGAYVAVGDPSANDGAGSVRVFNYVSGDWYGPTISDPTYSGFGYSVAISADGTRIAGSTQDDSPVFADEGPNPGCGSAETGPGQVFDWRDGSWQQTASTASSWALAMSADGNLIASGDASFFDPNCEPSPVLVYAVQASLSFDIGDGENAPVDMSGDRGSDVTVPTSEPTRTGFTFLGWNTASDGSGTNYTAGDTYTLPASEGDTLHAQWQPIPTTTVPVEVTPPAAEPAEPVSNTPTFTG